VWTAQVGTGAGRVLLAIDAAFADLPRFYDVEFESRLRDFTARNGTSGSLRDISTSGSAVRHQYMLVMTKEDGCWCRRFEVSAQLQPARLGAP
jgi:hypothetical protein